MGERAHGRQRQQRGMARPAAPSLPGAKATRAQPASGGGCLPQPRWAVCAIGAGAHQGQTSCEGERDIWWTAGTTREEQGTWASHTRKHSKADYGRPLDRGVWTAKTVKRPRQQPAQPQYADYWAPLTRKRHTMPQPAQPQHTNHWAPRTQKRHQQEHRPQRPTERSNPTQHAKGRTGDCRGPRKETTTRRNVTQRVPPPPSNASLPPPPPCPHCPKCAPNPNSHVHLVCAPTRPSAANSPTPFPPCATCATFRPSLVALLGPGWSPFFPVQSALGDLCLLGCAVGVGWVVSVRAGHFPFPCAPRLQERGAHVRRHCRTVEQLNASAPQCPTPQLGPSAAP